MISLCVSKISLLLLTKVCLKFPIYMIGIEILSTHKQAKNFQFFFFIYKHIDIGCTMRGSQKMDEKMFTSKGFRS